MSTPVRISICVSLLLFCLACKDKKAPEQTEQDQAKETEIQSPGSMEELGKMPSKMVNSVKKSLQKGADRNRRRGLEQ